MRRLLLVLACLTCAWPAAAQIGALGTPPPIDPGATIAVTGAVTTIAGTVNQITASAATGPITLSLPSLVAVTAVQVGGTPTQAASLTVVDAVTGTHQGILYENLGTGDAFISIHAQDGGGNAVLGWGIEPTVASYHLGVTQGNVLQFWFGGFGTGAKVAEISGSSSTGLTALRGLLVSGGNLDVSTGSASVCAGCYLGDRSRSLFRSLADASMRIANHAETGFTEFDFGPVTGNTATGTWYVKNYDFNINMATAAGSGTGSVTLAGFAPAGCVLEGFTARVTTILAGVSLTTWSVGPSTATTAYGTGLALAQNTLVSPATFTIATTGQVFTTAPTLTLTAAAGVFSTGILHVTTTCKVFVPIGS